MEYICRASFEYFSIGAFSVSRRLAECLWNTLYITEELPRFHFGYIRDAWPGANWIRPPTGGFPDGPA